MIEVPLSRGLVTLIDDEDADVVLRHTWWAKKPSGKRNVGFYAYTSIWVNGKNKTVHLHRLILDAPRTMVVDHINHDTLDNRRANLRLCSQGQNMANRKAHGSVPYRGVHKRPGLRNPYGAIIGKDGRKLWLGGFPTAEEAARAWDEAARELYGEFAHLNFPEIQP